MHDESTVTAGPGLDAEQSVVDTLYARLDALRDEANVRLVEVRRSGPSGSPQNRSERDAFATLYEDRIAQLDAVEDRLCFGRLDMASRERLYVGRIGLSDEEHVPLLTDWRAPAATPFYAATAAHPSGVINRRHLTTRGRTVMAVEDDVLDVEALRASGQEESLAGEGALLAALDAKRTGRMGDIVATIQSEQDAVIRAPMQGALVVQGGPGTGKTAVALHRAAYLLYHHRDLLERRGVLLIGPSTSFLRYIDHVLPSLGETGAVSTTLAGLVRGIGPTVREADDIAMLKGRADMAGVIRAAVRERQRVPRKDQEFRVDGRPVVLKRSDVREAQSRARRDGKPHNEARAAFAKEMISRLSRQVADYLGPEVEEADRKEIARDLRDDRDIRVAINLCWMPITPVALLRDLLSKRHLLDACASRLSVVERDLLSREADAPLTDADIPLLDEAAELLGELPQAAAPKQDRKAEIQYAKEVLESFGASSMIKVSAEMLADRMQAPTLHRSVAERAAEDRSWTYGHVVVDEAQELSPMAWRMLLRRCPSRSFTIVGDVAQTSSPAGTRWWPETMDPQFQSGWHLRELTVSYRIPAAVAQAAQSFARAAGLPVSEISAAREVDDAVMMVAVTHSSGVVAGALRTAADEVDSLAKRDGGLVAIIAPNHLVTALTDGAPEGVEVLTARDAKGLEYDAVVIASPADIADVPADLYVALTRPTRRLVLVHAGELPSGLVAL
ncbi:AAA family ATPase [Demequina sp. TTPB684]|uniref:HelD family protein n=1 Tax=unclassified Demequina TaxID=2620311 RepID=UPI001CF29AD9|nr:MULTISPECIES: AAA family ATPase [unclassified Demequina]MCB2413749.1 AAA family ATPase [Demequina sp. TTPB684]UPU89580.1 AAA family ATPase [Demequina sp. TMPB413]